MKARQGYHRRLDLLEYRSCATSQHSFNESEVRTGAFGKMRKNSRKKPKMSTVDFCQGALRGHIAPPAVGSAKLRISKAARKLGWSVSRTKDVWYADPRVSIDGEELRDVEALTGLKYGRDEAKELDEAINRASALLADMPANSPRSLAHALLEAARILAGAGT